MARKPFRIERGKERVKSLFDDVLRAQEAENYRAARDQLFVGLMRLRDRSRDPITGACPITLAMVETIFAEFYTTGVPGGSVSSFRIAAEKRIAARNRRGKPAGADAKGADDEAEADIEEAG